MQRINTPNGLFSDGTPEAGYLDGTIVLARWLNDIQEEICGVLEAMGIAPNGTSQLMLLMALQKMFQSASMIVGNDTGVANAYVVAYNPPVTALTDGMMFWFKAKTANTAASTLKINGLTAKSILGPAHIALQGGEIVANGKCLVVWKADSDAFVLVESTGGARQVAAPTKDKHAVQLAQVNLKADKATTLAGYGITDAYTQEQVNTALNAKADKATTLAGYGITDAYTRALVDSLVGGRIARTGDTMSGPLAMPNNVALQLTSSLGISFAALYCSALNEFIIGEPTLGMYLKGNGLFFNTSADKIWRDGLVVASFGASGYIKFPNGWMVQWGSQSVPANTTQSYALPTTFPTAHRQALCSPIQIPQSAVGCNPVSASQISLSNISTTSSQVISYLSIGH
ncbi:hypothetical protein QO239_23625 [Cupriavidus taiwanensis]|uniref:gp53-like domain-containing protein n=1 Tax=Cupriavidus taiwanensis TaxID=164546 RepID=UPI002542352B|nr:hypothetical protein [Cupriavidus taiwanensis]MDK3025589.1 hypothetical protein [Cupriavidus taiwanensis]